MQCSVALFSSTGLAGAGKASRRGLAWCRRTWWRDAVVHFWKKWRTMFWLWDKPSIMESPTLLGCSYFWCLLCDLRPKFLFWFVELVRSIHGKRSECIDISEFLELRLLGPSCGLMLFGFAFLFSTTFLCRQWAQKPWCRMRDTLPITVDVTLQNLAPQEDPWLDVKTP